MTANPSVSTAITPGSREAIAKGCRCDPYRNVYGNGVATFIGREKARVFFPAEDCPLHATPEKDSTND